MAIRYKTKCFVFKKSNRLEADRLFLVFSEELGRIEVLGRAIRKIASKLRGGIDIFSLSEIEFIQGKNYKTLTDTILIKKFENIISNPEKTEIFDKITNVLSNLINGQEKDKYIWVLLLEVLEKINSSSFSKEKYQIIYYYFLWNFFSVLGYSPEIYKCSVCRGSLNSNELYFSEKEGGIVCANCIKLCNNAQKINQNEVKIMRIILERDWETLLKLKIDSFIYDSFKKVSDFYYYYLLSCHSFVLPENNFEMVKEC